MSKLKEAEPLALRKAIRVAWPGPHFPPPLINLIASYAISYFMGMPLAVAEVCGPLGCTIAGASLCRVSAENSEVVLLYRRENREGYHVAVPIKKERPPFLVQHKESAGAGYGFPAKSYHVFKRSNGQFGRINASTVLSNSVVEFISRASKPAVESLLVSKKELAFCQYDFRTDAILFSTIERHKLNGGTLECFRLTSKTTHRFPLRERVCFAMGRDKETLLVGGTNTLYRIIIASSDVTALHTFPYTIYQGVSSPECTRLFVYHSSCDFPHYCTQFNLQGRGCRLRFTFRLPCEEQDTVSGMSASASTVAFLFQRHSHSKVIFWEGATGTSTCVEFEGSYSHIFLSESTLVLVTQGNSFFGIHPAARFFEFRTPAKK